MKRYERAAISLPGRICEALSEELDCAHPLVVETMFLLTHNHMREHHQESSFLPSSGPERMRSKASEDAAVRELTELFDARLASTPGGLPDESCPQRVFGGVECEGSTALLGSAWRASPVVFEISSDAQE